jgi:hypothetical protein
MVELKVPFEADGKDVDLRVGTINLAKMPRSIRWRRRSGGVDHIYVLGTVPAVLVAEGVVDK